MIDYKKNYERALEILKRIRNANRNNKELVDFIEFNYPELKESEDERIRQWIINEIKIKHHNLDEENVDFVDKAIAWLKKQGGQKETLCDKRRKTQPSHSCQDITELGRCALEKQGEAND